MKKILTSAFLFSFLVTNVYAQTQLENPGFENWEQISPTNTNLEPVNWSSIQSGIPENISNLAPQVVFSSNDAHSGSKSARLKNASAFGIVANGIITNGRILANLNPDLSNVFTDVDDPRWNTPFTGRPDSLVGYYKYTSFNGDGPLVQVLLHRGDQGTIPISDEVDIVSFTDYYLPAVSVTSWTRFSIPLDYENGNIPEYVLMNISAGAGTDAQANSEFWIDDLEFIYSTSSIQESDLNNRISAFSMHQQIVVDLNQLPTYENFILSIYDLTGRKLETWSAQGGSKTQSDYHQNGLYICTIETEEGALITRKVLIR
jgi:hypothetical protein